MILNRGGGIKYGIPYQGSKTKLMPYLAKMFPPADHFYDLFGGGFSVTHYMMEHRAKSFKHFHYNEIRPGLPALIQDAIDGKYNFNVFKPKWISREEFNQKKETDPYIKVVWSFGNNGRNYLFGKDIEEQKRSMHMAVVFDEFDDWFVATFGFSKWPNSMNITAKRLYLKKICRKRVELQQVQQSQQLERLQQLQQLEQLEQHEQLQMTNCDYKYVAIEPNSVIYCDIPYKGTGDYGKAFSHSEFFDWAETQANPVFISEYEIEDDRFFLLKEFSHRSTFAPGGLKNIPTVERLYGNRLAFDIIEKHRKK